MTCEVLRRPDPSIWRVSSVGNPVFYWVRSLYLKTQRRRPFDGRRSRFEQRATNPVTTPTTLMVAITRFRANRRR